MSRNSLIAVVVVAFVIVLGIFMVNVNKAPVVSDNPPTPSTPTNTGANPAPAPVPTAGAPIVAGDSNVVVSNSTAIVTGRVTPNGSATTYVYEYGESTSITNSSALQTLGSSYYAVNAPAYLTGLKANTLYYFRLSAQNAYGVTHGTMYSFKTNNTPPAPAIAPSVQTNGASSVARTAANVNGHVNPKTSDTSYWFEYGQTSSLNQNTALQSAGSSNFSEAVSASLSNLEPLTKYYFRINAQNKYGTVNGAILSFTTSGPAAPSKPSAVTNSATSVSTSTAVLNGKANTNGVDSTYWFEYSSDSLLGAVTGSVTDTESIMGGNSTVAVRANLSGLSRHTKYFGRLVVKNQYGTVYGDQVSFTTK